MAGVGPHGGSVVLVVVTFGRVTVVVVVGAPVVVVVVLVVVVVVGAQGSGIVAGFEASTLAVTVSQPMLPGPAAQPHQLFIAFMLPDGIAVPSAPLVVFPTIEFMCATVAAVAERMPTSFEPM